MPAIGTCILISAAGTPSAYTLITKAKKLWANSLRVLACDINPPHLIPASRIADEFFQVPLVDAPNYREIMLELLESQRVDVYVPLIDQDLTCFPSDDPCLADMGCVSTAPSSCAARVASDKRTLFAHLERGGVHVPKTIQPGETRADQEYFVKPRIGFGSRGVGLKLGREIRSTDFENFLIQEVCFPPEVTIEIFQYQGDIHTICRERIVVKSGVCTKTRIFHDPFLHQAAARIAEHIELPTSSCIQFMYDSAESRVPTDVNLRMAAGTALSAAAGWDLPAASLAVWTGVDQEPMRYLKTVRNDTYVARVFHEVVMK